MWSYRARSGLRHGITAVTLAILSWSAGGCQRPDQPPPDEAAAKAKAKPYPMRVIVADDPALAAAIERLWKARIDNELQLQQMTVAELEAARPLPADIVIYPSACLGTLVEHDLLAVPSSEALEDPQYEARDVFELQRRIEGRWGTEIYGFSMGSPLLVLMYRADLFEALKLTPPRTWAEYQELVPRLGRDALGAAAPPADRPWHATIEPRAAGWGGRLLLARAAAYAAHPSQFSTFFDYDSMRPLIAGPPFERALAELVAVNAGSPHTQLHSPDSARAAMLRGEAAMALTWPHRAGSEAPVSLAPDVRIGFAELPGATEVYNFVERTWTRRDAERAEDQVPLLATAGRLASVTKHARRPRETARILALLTGREWSREISPTSPAATLFRQSHVQDPQRWTDEGLPREAAAQYAEVVRDALSRPTGMVCLRIPGYQRYLAALDQAVQDACAGTQTPPAALASAAEAWIAITTELGMDSQRTAYMRSLGLEP
ncbi:MAG: extracellular solute-binding protein [Pirellulaceae bacterium]|jgi:ABC-type glycerol-3-phosphate transport system substrate-binding protein|nr:extracellular solute-binding protein [Pirellulaceae bacterium]